MTFMTKFLGAATVLAMTSAVNAEPALMYDLGGKFDGSFNESAYNGAQRWAEETGESYREIEVTQQPQRVQFATRLAEAGFNPIVVLGFANGPTLEEVAPKYPDTTFAIIDMVVDQPNVRSIVFTEHEGSYLAGMLAAMASETGTLGFVAGMDIPLIRQFACGYAQGAKSVNPDIDIVYGRVSDDPTKAWSDTGIASELAKAQISQGADVIYAAAGGAGEGALRAAAEADLLGIGVDSNQNGLFPGKVLTSMLKRVDNAVYNAFSDGVDMETGIVVMDLAAEGVGYALDENNADLVTAEMQATVDAARDSIIAGETTVVSYTENDSCPAMDF
ncbi:MAG: BMP family ABC transporter substrate-binding protein [Pseudomonadota bacterium]